MTAANEEVNNVSGNERPNVHAAHESRSANGKPIARKRAPRHSDIRRRRGGFTLIEVLLASIIATFVLGSIALTMTQLSRLKETSKLRLDAHLRAEAALNALRRDVASVIRSDDLYWTRLLIREGTVISPMGVDLMRDEILVFNNRLSAIQDLNFSGEGTQYETQYRIEETPLGTMLWQRRDPVPDENPLAGGIATPLVESVIAMKLEAYDGYEWTSQWDSDERGLPLAVRVTVMASGARSAETLYDGPFAQLRTVVPIDRVLPPLDAMKPTKEELELMLAEAEDVTQRPTNSNLERARQRIRDGGTLTSPGRPGSGRGAPGRPGSKGSGGGGKPGAGSGGGAGSIGGSGSTGGTGGASTWQRPSFSGGAP